MSSVCKSFDILIVDTQRIFREGLHTLLQNTGVAGNIMQAGNAAQALLDLRSNDCDLVMMGSLTPAVTCCTCLREMKRLYPRIKVIGLGTFDDDEHVGGMFDNGADGYLLTDTDRAEIELAISSVIGGRHYFSHDLSSGVVDRTRRRIEESRAERTAPISERELDILRLLFDELSSKEIACRLYISERTVEFYRQSLIRKTGAKNIVGLIKYAISNSLIKGWT